MPDSNNPKVLVEFSPDEASWIMDLLHEEWNRRVIATALSVTPIPDAHVRQYHKHMSIRLRSRVDDRAWQQGFCPDGIGL